MSNCNNTSNVEILSAKFKEYLAYESEEKLTWCSGCGNYGILNALNKALVLAELKPADIVLCFDVGCNGNASDKIQANTIHGLHGRVISLAAGCSLANSNLKIVAMAGDGATFSEGINHLVHGVRNNYNVTFIHHDNGTYGLTTGQASATTKKNIPMNGSPDGVTADPINPLQVVLSLNPSFVARTFSGDNKHMTETIKSGLKHPGFSFIEVMQVCPTYNKFSTKNWYWDRIKYIEDIKKYDKSDIWQARKIVEDLDNELYMGVLYENKEQLQFIDRVPYRKKYKTEPIEEVQHVDIKELLKEFE